VTQNQLLFAHLDKDDRTELFQFMMPLRFEANHDVIRQGAAHWGEDCMLRF
jgi:hypothetical protein